MKISSLSYLIRQGLKNIWRNRLMSVTAIGVLTVCLIMVGAAELVSLNINQVVDFVQSENEMVIFLDDGIDEMTAFRIGDTIKSHKNVDKVRYVSSAQAMQEQREALGENADLLDGLDENLLPAKYVVNVKELDAFEKTAKELSGIEGVMSVSAATDIASTLTDVGKMVTTFGLAMIAALAIIAVVIMVNTIKAAIFNRRKEINIMRYIGATTAFIRIPFIVEGIVLGAVSAGLSFVAVMIAYNGIVENMLGGQSGWLNSAMQTVIVFDSIALPLGGAFLVAGIFIGVFGSLISMHKYAKV